MKRLALAMFLPVFAVSGASAFLFGRISDKEASVTLKRMAGAFGNRDCSAVEDLSERLFGENPSSAMREKAYSYLGRCYESQGLTDKAVTLYKLAHGLYPKNRSFLSRLAVIYMQSGFYDTAIPLFEEALSGRPGDISANAGLARCYASLGFLSKAKTYYSRAVVSGEFGDLPLLKEYASWMLRKRDWEEAELILGYAVALAPEDPLLREALARAKAGRGDYAGASAHLREASALAPSDRTLVLELALTELLGGDYEPALAAVPDTRSEKDALALMLRGMALSKKGNGKEAAECFRKAALSKEHLFIAAFAAALDEEVRRKAGAYEIP